jgi:hypothetical protein
MEHVLLSTNVSASLMMVMAVKLSIQLELSSLETVRHAHAQAASSTVKAQSVHQPVISLSSHALLTGNASMAHKSVTTCMTAVIDQMKKTAALQPQHCHTQRPYLQANVFAVAIH